MSETTGFPEGPRWLRLAELAEAGLLAATLMHELRQPLFALRALGQLGEQAGLSPDQARELLDISAHLDDLVADFGQLGRTEAPRVYDLNDAVRSVARILAHRAREGAVELTVDYATGALLVSGEPGVARQVAVNLIANAIDAAPRGRVRVRTRRRGNRICLRVSDTGAGVDDADKARIFDAFVTSKADDKGTGLGLFVVRSLLAREGGTVVVRDREGGGAEFEAELPAAT